MPKVLDLGIIKPRTQTALIEYFSVGYFPYTVSHSSLEPLEIELIYKESKIVFLLRRGFMLWRTRIVFVVLNDR